jgi:hypothetical protein
VVIFAADTPDNHVATCELVAREGQVTSLVLFFADTEPLHVHPKFEDFGVYQMANRSANVRQLAVICPHSANR